MHMAYITVIIYITAVDHCFPLKPQSVNHMPCWPKEVAHLRTDSLFSHANWLECGKPNTGEVAWIMRSTRAKYHRAIRRLKQNELQTVRHVLLTLI